MKEVQVTKGKIVNEVRERQIWRSEKERKNYECEIDHQRVRRPGEGMWSSMEVI